MLFARAKTLFFYDVNVFDAQSKMFHAAGRLHDAGNE